MDWTLTPAQQKGVLDALLSPEMQKQRQNQGLMGLATGLLEASGPSRVPVGWGQALGTGMKNMQAADDAYMDRVYKEMALGAQMREAMAGKKTDFDRTVDTYMGLPEGDPRKEMYKAQIEKQNTNSSMFAPLPVYDPATGGYQYINKANAMGGNFLPPQAGAEAEARRREEEKAAREAAKASQTQVEDFVNKTESDGLTELATSLQTLNTNLSGFQEEADLPGYGATGAAPDFMLTQGGKDLRQDVAAVRNAIMKARSGGSVTEGEAGRLLQEIGEGTLRSDDQLRRGIEKVTQFVEARINNRYSVLSPEARDLYGQRGGKLKPGATKAAPKGGDERTVVKTQVSPSTGKRRIVYSDGTEEIQ